MGWTTPQARWQHNAPDSITARLSRWLAGKTRDTRFLIAGGWLRIDCAPAMNVTAEEFNRIIRQSSEEFSRLISRQP